MELYSDLDTSSESDYESDQDSTTGSNQDEDEPYENIEPEVSEMIDEYENAPWNLEAQLQAHFNTARLAQLHTDIKAPAKLLDPTYEKFPGPGLLGHLIYEYYLITYSTQSTILSCFGTLRSGIHLLAIPMRMRNIRRLGIRRISQKRS
jgi:hypothetical protein